MWWHHCTIGLKKQKRTGLVWCTSTDNGDPFNRHSLYFFWDPGIVLGILRCMEANCLQTIDYRGELVGVVQTTPNCAPLGQCGTWNVEETNWRSSSVCNCTVWSSDQKCAQSHSLLYWQYTLLHLPRERHIPASWWVWIKNDSSYRLGPAVVESIPGANDICLWIWVLFFSTLYSLSE